MFKQNEDKANGNIEIEDLMHDLELGVVNKTQDFDNKYEEHQFWNLDPNPKSLIDNQDLSPIAIADKKELKVGEKSEPMINTPESKLKNPNVIQGVSNKSIIQTVTKPQEKTKFDTKDIISYTTSQLADTDADKPTSKSSNNVDLSKRQDVLNKSLLRTLKKYFTSKFNQETNYASLKSYQKKSKFLDMWVDFVDCHYGSKTAEAASEFGITYDDIYRYIAIMINPELAKKRMRNKKHIRFLKLYYEVLYNYSSKKLILLFNDQVLHYLFDDLKKQGAMHQMIHTDATLVKNKDEYMRTLDEFMQSFDEAKSMNQQVKASLTNKNHNNA